MSTYQENFFKHNPTRARIYTTTVVAGLTLAFLCWEYFHGGVVSHHLLAQKDLPSVSNWWGIVSLPLLTWILVGRMQRRLQKESSGKSAGKSRIVPLFLIALVFGVTLSLSFVNQYNLFLDNVPYIVLLLSLLVPIYYAEFILGFVLGMTFTFGAILPVIAISIFAAVGFVIHRFIRPLIMKGIMAVVPAQKRN